MHTTGFSARPCRYRPRLMVMSREDKARLEEWAAAYAAEALSATTFKQRDMNTGDQIRDFDLIFDDDPPEPLKRSRFTPMK